MYRLIDQNGVVCAVGTMSAMEFAKAHFLVTGKKFTIEKFTPDVRPKTL